jgi:hypothetical protein
MYPWPEISEISCGYEGYPSGQVFFSMTPSPGRLRKCKSMLHPPFGRRFALSKFVP